MTYVLKLLRLADTAVVKTTKLTVILGMLVLFALLMMRIVARALEIPFVAFDEIGELATVWMILAGVVAMWREGSLYSVDFFNGKSSRAALLLNLVIQVLMFSFAAILVWQGGKFTLMNREMSAFLLINMDYYYGAIPVAASLMAIYSLKSFVMRLCEFSSGKTTETYEREPDISGPAGQF